MSVRLYIPDELPEQIQPSWLEAIFQIWLEKMQPKLDGDVLLQVVCREEMQHLASVHLGKSEATDVLSFNYTPPLVNGLEDKVSGEIIICEDVAQENAIRLKTTFELECVTLCVHGLLHIAGLDHATEKQRHHFEEETRAIMGAGGLKAVSLWSD